MISSTTHVCVVIAARDAAGTIQLAVRSARHEEQVVETVVVDDSLAVGTSQAALACDKLDALTTRRLQVGAGPTARPALQWGIARR